MGTGTGHVAEVAYKDILEAYERISPYIKRTPIETSRTFSDMSGYKVYMKLENLQKTGAFKIRGALNKVLSLSDEEIRRGIIACSAGNHAQGVAYSARLRGAKAVIVMPEGTPKPKVNATRNYGAEVILHGKVFDEALEYTMKLIEEKGYVFVHPFDDPKVIAGQGTIAIEILQDLKDFDAIVVPIGGGGLISGIAIAIKAVNPKIKVIGVQSKGAPSMKLSVEKGHVIELETINTIAEGIAVRRPGELTFKIISELVDDIVLVSDDDLKDTIYLLLTRNKLVGEPAGVAGLAAILFADLGIPKGAKIITLISGGNIGMDLLLNIIQTRSEKYN
ncbi:MAG: threonine ammonia-lyase [Euryarchaeota archaeon]|nr:threonine ammonia-lyase [Euryarchaeota archaeon]